MATVLTEASIESKTQRQTIAPAATSTTAMAKRNSIGFSDYVKDKSRRRDALVAAAHQPDRIFVGRSPKTRII